MSSVEKLYHDMQKDLYPPMDCKKYVSSKERLYSIDHLTDYKKVLDVGCGNGSFLAALSKNNHKCIGIDISEPMVELTSSLNIEARKINIEDQKVPSEFGQFDAITMFQVLEHLYDPLTVLIKNVLPSLRSGGRFLCSVPNAVYLKYRISILVGKIPTFGATEIGKWTRPYNLNHKTLFTFEGIRKTLVKSGLKSIKLKGFSGSKPDSINEFVKSHIGLPSLFCASIVAYGEKK